MGGWADRLIAQTCQARKFFNGILVAFKPIYVAKDSELIIIISSDILMDPTQLTELTDSQQKTKKQKNRQDQMGFKLIERPQLSSTFL